MATSGTWRFECASDPRWNCDGEFAQRFAGRDATEVLGRYDYLSALLGEPPKDLRIVYVMMRHFEVKLSASGDVVSLRQK